MTEQQTIRKLRDPVAVHVAMLRGEIAVPPLAELLHVYGATFSDLDAANIEIAKARETLRQLQLDEIAELRDELVRKTDELPVVAVIEQINLGAGVTYLSVAPKTPLPPAGTELIARPARKGE